LATKCAAYAVAPTASQGSSGVGGSGVGHDYSPPPDTTYHRPQISEVSEVSDRSIVSQLIYISYISASKAAVWCGGVCW